MTHRDDTDIQSLLEVLAHEPTNSHALSQLGILYHKQARWQDAIHTYQQVLHLQPDDVKTYYNLGLAYSKSGDVEKAIASYKTLLDIEPDNAATCFQLGCLFLQGGQITQALGYFLQVESQDALHFETQSNLGTCYLKQGALQQARLHYVNAHRLRPDDLQIVFNLGVIHLQLGAVDAAIQCYQHALRINPNDYATHHNLAAAFLARQQTERALVHFRVALQLQPDNTALQYTLQSLSQNQTCLTAPSDYIVRLFDSYADHYDAHLRDDLHYQVPELLRLAIPPTYPLRLAQHSILDLGCGTGLCGAVFKPYAKTLVGIDLSPNMIQIASDKHLYDELITNHIVDALTLRTQAFDIIVAGDVLVYTGDLNALFSAVRLGLHPQGLFIFNTEISEDQAFEMKTTGRFAHQREYLEQLAQDHHFNPIFYKKIIARMQNNEPVHGHLYVLQATL